MTSASELFYNRRSRLSRAAASTSTVGDLGFGIEHAADRNLHFPHHRGRQSQSHHGHRHDSDGCDPLRRTPHLRHHRFSSQPERPSLSLDQSNWQSGPSNSSNTEPQRNTRRPGVSSSDRLPGSVLLARERLLERLRGVSLSGNRRSSREPSRITRENVLDDHWRLADASDWGAEISIQFAASGAHFNNSTLLPEQTISSSTKKPPGLSQEALDQLHLQISTYSEKGGECTTERKSQDCSICLESFIEGDKLICLPCDHIFHSDCLDPWVRTCGDCPYCRKGIIVPTYRNQKT